jgi:hypothetical protein
MSDTTSEMNEGAQAMMEEQSDRFDKFFEEGGDDTSPAPAAGAVEPDGDPVKTDYDDPFGADEPFLKDNPDYDPDALDDPDNPAPEVPETPVETPEVVEAPETPETPEAPEVEPEAPVVDAAAEKAAFLNDIVEQFKTANLDPNMGKAFAAAKYETKQAKADLAAAQAEGISTPEMQEVTARAERLSGVEVELKAAQDKLALFDFQTTPEYKQEIEAPYQALAASSGNIETAASIPEGAILKAISVGDKATQDANIQQLSDNYNISPRDLNTIYNNADSMLNITSKDAELRTTAQERLSESRSQAEAREAYVSEQEQGAYRTSLRDTFKDYEGKIGAFLNDDGSNNEKWDAAIKDSESLDFKGDPEIQSLGAFALTAVPHLMEQNNAFSAEIAKLKALQGRNNAAAPPSATNTSTVNTPKATPKAGVSFSDAIGARIAAGGF